jgi:hypothetical protein
MEEGYSYFREVMKFLEGYSYFREVMKWKRVILILEKL